MAAPDKTIHIRRSVLFDGTVMDFTSSWPLPPLSTVKNEQASAVDEEMEEALQQVQSIIGYTFRNLSLLEEALTHSSNLTHASYQRLEFVGDAVLNLAITNFLFLTYPSVDPGYLSKLRAANISNEKLARVAIRHGFYRYLRCNDNKLDLMVKEFTVAVSQKKEDCGELSFGGSSVKAPKVLADIVESIAAAIYADCNFNLVEFWKVFRGILEPIITELPNQQPVTHLYELCQKNGMNPEFKNWKNNNINITNVYIDGELCGTGSSEQKNIAKLNAARDALQKLCYDEIDPMEIADCSLSTSGKWEDQEASGQINSEPVISSKALASVGDEVDGSKQKLHQLCSQKHWPKPVFRVEEKQGPAHDLRFLCSVTVHTDDKTCFACGDPKSRLRESENSAAYKLLCLFGMG